QAYENRLTQLPISCPFGELYLANKNRINPLASAHHRGRDALDPSRGKLGGQVSKWTIITLLAHEAFVEGREQLGVKSSPNLTSKEQAFLLVVADQQCAEILPRALRWRKT